MSSSGRSFVRVLWTLAATSSLVVGCATDDEEKRSEPSPDAGSPAVDSGSSEPAKGAVRTPVSAFDSGAPTSGEFCSALVAAECDGAEDCPTGQTCCGIVNGGALRYDSIKCQDTCDLAAGGHPLCHPGDACDTPTDAGDAFVCQRSLILPSYLAVCIAPSSLVPTDFTGKPAAAHTINCGADLTCGAGTKCCVLGNWDAATRTITTRTGYCAPVDEDCDCTKAPKTDGG